MEISRGHACEVGPWLFVSGKLRGTFDVEGGLSSSARKRREKSGRGILNAGKSARLTDDLIHKTDRLLRLRELIRRKIQAHREHMVRAKSQIHGEQPRKTPQ